MLANRPPGPIRDSYMLGGSRNLSRMLALLATADTPIHIPTFMITNMGTNMGIRTATTTAMAMAISSATPNQIPIPSPMIQA